MPKSKKAMPRKVRPEPKPRNRRKTSVDPKVDPIVGIDASVPEEPRAVETGKPAEVPAGGDPSKVWTA